MPTTVTSTKGTVFHLWQLPDLTTPEPEEVIEFTELENDLSDGYYSQRLLGSDTGLRSWKLKAPTLAALSVLPNTVTDINGAETSRLDYVRSLYMESKISGTPFVFISPINGQYYPVRFADPNLSLQRAKIQLYSTGIELKQVRILGETVYNMSVFDALTGGIRWDEANHGSGEWDTTFPATTVWKWEATDDVVFSANPQNGHNTVRLSGTTDTGVLNLTFSSSPSGIQTWDAFMVVKVREDTFSNDAGLLYDTGNAASMLVGSNGTTKFQNLSLDGFEYRLNGVLYPQSNQQAPMNRWGVVHYRHRSGSYEAGQIGQVGATAGTFGKFDIGEVIIPGSLVSLNACRELTEHLVVKWGIT